MNHQTHCPRPLAITRAFEFLASRRTPWAVVALLLAAAVGAHGVALSAPSESATLAQGVCSGTMRSASLVGAALQRAKARAELNAFITLDEAGALEAARRIDADVAAGKVKKCRPLEGVPIVVKDNIEVAGLPATAGTPALAKFVPKADAPVVKKLRDAGAIVLGKTNMHELAFGISGYNPAFKTGAEVGVRNAYDVTRSAGGSSSGTGAAIGARVVTAGLGTDTGGSVRVPCAFNGCAALRPTIKRYPSAGIAPISHTRDTAGPMARTMADVELLDRVITGAPAAGPVVLKGVRLGLPKPLLANMDADTKAAFDAAVAKLRDAGAVLVDVDMPGLMETNGAVSFPIAMFEAHDDMVKYLRATGTGITIQQLAAQAASPDVKGTYEGLVIPRKLPGPNNTLIDSKPAYTAAMKSGRPKLIRLYADTFRRHKIEALMFPTVPQIAMAANAESSSVPVFMRVIQNTDPGSNAGLPGVQVPIALGATTKLPVGLELDGPAGSDRRLISIGLAVQAVMGPLPAPVK